MNIGNYLFDGPFDPALSFKNDFAAVYTIIDEASRIIDVGQTGSINERFPYHDRRHLWPRHSQGVFKLYVYIEDLEQNRLTIESFIRETYNPPVGER